MSIESRSSDTKTVRTSEEIAKAINTYQDWQDRQPIDPDKFVHFAWELTPEEVAAYQAPMHQQ